MAAPNNAKGQVDGWNDPPLFTYNVKAGTGISQRTNLNKRVSYPLSSPTVPSLNSSNDGVLLSPKDGPPKLPPVQILPPTTSTSIHPPVPLLVPQMSPPIDPSSLPPSFASAGKDPQHSETLPELLERLQLDSRDALRKYTKRVLHETVDSLKDSIQGRSREDVQKRLGLLDDQWRDEKLSEGAAVKLGCLATAISNDDLKQADALHLSLMVDHISEVSQWMVGVKRLINELKLVKSSLNPANFEEKANSESLQDVCMDTDKFPKTQPLLVPDIVGTASYESAQQQQEEEKSLYPGSTENPPGEDSAAGAVNLTSTNS